METKQKKKSPSRENIVYTSTFYFYRYLVASYLHTVKLSSFLHKKEACFTRAVRGFKDSGITGGTELDNVPWFTELASALSKY